MNMAQMWPVIGFPATSLAATMYRSVSIPGGRPTGAIDNELTGLGGELIARRDPRCRESRPPRDLLPPRSDDTKTKKEEESRMGATQMSSDRRRFGDAHHTSTPRKGVSWL
ncbi:MAG: hypothetical protein ACRDOO_09820 [Actinomadura sp.]